MSIIKNINIAPDRTLYDKLGQTGYSFSEAISELVDNAIDARLDNSPVYINIIINSDSITIADNAKGMGEKDAMESIRLGSSNKKGNYLGQFGLGLKSACNSIGSKFTLFTTPVNSNFGYRLEFDKDVFQDSGSWESFPMEITDNEKNETSGTTVKIENLHNKINESGIKRLKKELQERFSSFIINKEAEIIINKEKIKPELVDIAKDTKEQISIKLSSGDIIRGWVALLKMGSQEKSGFNLYYKNRLIKTHEKIGYSYHPSKMWIFGEINLDCIKPTINKREFNQQDPLYIEFLEQFSEIIKPFLAKAQERHRENEIKDLPEEVKETIKDNLIKAMNRTEELQDLAFETDKPSNRDINGEEFEKEKREGWIVGDIKNDKVDSDNINKKNRTPNKTHLIRTRYVTIKNKKYKFNFKWDTLVEDTIPKIAELDRERGEIIVTLNNNFSALNITKDKSFYVSLYVAEGIAEVFLRENNQSLDKNIMLRDKLFKQFCDINSEDIEVKSLNKETDTDLLIVKLQKYQNNPECIKNVLTDGQFAVIDKIWNHYIRENKKIKLSEISEEIGVSRERVRQIYNQASQKIIDKLD